MTALSTSDSDLVRRVQRGEKEAFSELVSRFQDLAHGLAYYRLGNFEDARDAAQAAFIRAYQELPGLRDGDAFRAWLEPLQYPSAIAWALDRDIKVIEHACDLVLEAAGIEIERASLADELRRIVADGGPWMEVAAFRKGAERLRPVVEVIDVPLVLSDGGIGPNVLVDVEGRFAGFDVLSWARIEDPHYGITKYWTYGCWPLRRAGIVERHLVRYGLTLREFAPRLAVRALATLQREIPAEGGDEGYRSELLGWLEKGMDNL